MTDTPTNALAKEIDKAVHELKDAELGHYIRVIYPRLMAALAPAADDAETVARRFNLGDHVEKISGSRWRGKVVGFYSTSLTPEGYAVESERERGSVQIYPRAALRAMQEEGK